MNPHNFRPTGGGCPSWECLLAFHLGKLPLERLEAVAAHLGVCPSCEAAYRKLEEKGNPIFPELGQPCPEDEFSQEPECQRLESQALTLLGDLPPGGLPGDFTPFPWVPGYRLQAKVGQGSLGTVYRAEQKGSNRVVALKLVSRRRALDARGLQRFFEDVKEVERLTQGRILPLIDLQKLGPMLVLVRPFIAGADLRTIITARRYRQEGKAVHPFHPLALADECAYVGQVLLLLDRVLEAVALVHQAKRRFREIKPSNCLVDPTNDVWLCDFGVNRLVDHWGMVRWVPGSPDRPEPDLRLGELGFISPEEWGGQRHIDQRADVFALGVTAYQALALRLPYGLSSVSIRKPLPELPSKWQPLLPPVFDALILKALVSDRAHRYPSAVAFWEAWQQARQAVPLPTFETTTGKGVVSRVWYWTSSMTQKGVHWLQDCFQHLGKSFR